LQIITPSKTTHKIKMDNLLEQIDNIKTKITDQEYRDLMDNLSELHSKNTQYEVILVALTPSKYTCVRDNKVSYNMGYKKIRPSKVLTPCPELLDKYLEETQKNGLISSAIPHCQYDPIENILQLHFQSNLLFDAEDNDDDDEDYKGKFIEVQRYGMISIKKCKN